ncbi:MAG: restriction endonuclease [Microcoleaceae cyanobacterium]
MSEIIQTTKPIQKILFGSPGTGKSYKVRNIATNLLKIKWNQQTKSLENTIKTVFHPEYTYSDFVGKLLPQTTGSSVIYKFYHGHFLRALGLAYKHLINDSNENVLLVIDELNRGNAAAIFGPIFQLLDRETDNWSTYDVNLSELEIVGLLRAMGYDTQTTDKNIQVDGSNFDVFCNMTKMKLEMNNNYDGLRVLENLKKEIICFPRNLSLIATINTSDESIYYLDSAFKRRWDWEYVDVPGYGIEKIKDIAIEGRDEKWFSFVNKLNDFIKVNHHVIRRIEDKQIGVWFLKPEENQITKESIENKLMFYLWDSVFPRDRRPLEDLLSKADRQNIKLITYSDFIGLSDDFINAIISCEWLTF